MTQTKVPKKITAQVTELLRARAPVLIEEFWDAHQDQFEEALVESGGKLGFTISGKIDADKPTAEMRLSLSFHKQVKGSYQATVDDPDQEQLFVGGEAGLGMKLSSVTAQATATGKKAPKKKASKPAKKKSAKKKAAPKGKS